MGRGWRSRFGQERKMEKWEGRTWTGWREESRMKEATLRFMEHVLYAGHCAWRVTQWRELLPPLTDEETEGLRGSELPLVTGLIRVKVRIWTRVWNVLKPRFFSMTPWSLRESAASQEEGQVRSRNGKTNIGGGKRNKVARFQQIPRSSVAFGRLGSGAPRFALACWETPVVMVIALYQPSVLKAAEGLGHQGREYLGHWWCG